MRTVFAPARSVRPTPGTDQPHAELSEAEKTHVAGLMRVNHVGEICAQALYQGQALTSRDPAVTATLRRAADEETEHLAWTELRIKELGGRKSLLNPLWYAGALSIGVVAGKFGDRWNLGFLAETERQVEAHLSGHMARVPHQDSRSLAILEQMRRDEVGHAETAVVLGAADLPLPVRAAMKLASGVMTRMAYWV
ncbi:ubiquinone biosynthesis monooxygenase Coq7 [Niveibacterium umoris]|uniref:3-demethoxyubiquinol 3-hydroxylase n=1 Tax=Niveibacterium umoris TaxID=1193620 RepID=A0A840BNM1_9RHOO|nr:ubiquinone biosynthesis monooxygenase Coq7 [Niveibacterium umoris]